jgi:hypothetical protein
MVNHQFLPAVESLATELARFALGLVGGVMVTFL